MSGVRAELVAVVIAVADQSPLVLASGRPARLPSGPLASQQRSLQSGVRSFVAEQSGHRLAHVEQLYTFADADRLIDDGRVVSISYLGLTRVGRVDSSWTSLYELLPWEDLREGRPSALHDVAEQVRSWAGDSAERKARACYLLGYDGSPWRAELALQRYELLWEAGLIAESQPPGDWVAPGGDMLHDHRRILATGLSRLRSTLQYRPMVFELVPDEFTLGQLQDVVEALAGQRLHTQNFRRLIEQQHQLVVPTGGQSRATGGRPARLYRFRPELVAERQHVGTKLPRPRT